MKWLNAVQEVARLCGQHALSHFRTSLAVDEKGDGSPVTKADREAEALAREWILKHFPDDGIIGEEGGSHRPEAFRKWVVDPIDGTKAFIHGVPLWGTLVAVIEGEEVKAGAIFLPALNDMVAAERGQGCFHNGVRCFVSGVDALGAATVLTTDAGRLLPHVAALLDGAKVARTWGDCFGYALVATGRAEVMIDPVLAVWDVAALSPIIEEAGGVLTDMSGVRQEMGHSAVATNRALAEKVKDMLRGRATPRPAFSLEDVNFEKGGGLVPVVTQDATSGAVLMVAYADREALSETLKTGFMHYKSRSRGLWKKGETSGHVQTWESLTLDCDQDTVLARVKSAGPACHTMEATCFGPVTSDSLQALDDTLQKRLQIPDEGSYTQKLFADANKRMKKLGEETTELVVALTEKNLPKAVEEVADVVFHALVALAASGGRWADVREVLKRREGVRRH